jgi:signal transduction histidine kinase
LRALTAAARTDPPMRETPALAERGPSDVRDLIAAFNIYRARIIAMLSDKDRMLGAVGHDLRTPLASLRVRVEQIDDAALRGKMIASIEEMTAMLTDILALARTGAGTEPAEHIALAPLLSALVAEYSERGVAVSLGDHGGDVRVEVRTMLLRRALRNLIDNAVAYGRVARVGWTVDGGQVRIVVADDGPGLAPDQIEALMQPFARGEQSRNRATGGSGLGLTIARGIAEGEGGSLHLRNRTGGGLDAILTLPLAVQQ